MSKTIFRPPVVTILGHVDHGKTTLLDYIRKSHIVKKEVGGITQKIGAYEISTEIKGYPIDRITFIDTPGHEIFTQLRSRGANVADIAILLIDAKESVMPQTVESIFHIKSAKIPFIIAINKIDLPGADIEKVKRDLVKHKVIVEDKGGDIVAIPISAKTGKGVNDLLEAILFLSNELNLSYSPTNPLEAYIIETKKDKRGIVVSAIIKDGKLSIGDFVYTENKKIKIRSILNDRGEKIKEAIPSTPCELLGFEEFPQVGSKITSTAQTIKKELKTPPSKRVRIEDLLVQKKEEKKLNIIIRADSYGSLEAITNSLEKKGNIHILLKGVGNINKSDVFLAKTTKAIIIGFSVNIEQEIKDLSKQEKVLIKTYNIIYKLLEELHEVADLLKEKEEKEKNIKGEVKILATFVIDNQTVYGVRVVKGKINLGDSGEVYRNEKKIGKVKLVSLKIKTKKVVKVKKNQEAGMVFDPQLDIKIGDMIKFIL